MLDLWAPKFIHLLIITWGSPSCSSGFWSIVHLLSCSTSPISLPFQKHTRWIALPVQTFFPFSSLLHSKPCSIVIFLYLSSIASSLFQVTLHEILKLYAYTLDKSFTINTYISQEVLFVGNIIESAAKDQRPAIIRQQTSMLQWLAYLVDKFDFNTKRARYSRPFNLLLYYA